ncbi:MAG: DUF3095 domain-containing protein [Hyphomicrobiaceae bacterium]|nr:DUF3095 domain-containing protein [Hyphomicrobiaceae bacterium]
MPQSGDDFYRTLAGFTEFARVTDLSLYRPVPDDWCMVLADITGSTKAIREGRYKDVNLVGAACITAVLNALPGTSVPYVFGGDGATLAVPASAVPTIIPVLGAARRLAREQFDLDLRAGIVPVADVRALGADVLVAKFELSPGNAMAMFTGGGIQLVDDLIKGPDGAKRYAVAYPKDDAAPDLEGLSCRWEPLKSRRGTMMSMLVHATGKSTRDNIAIYREVIDGVAEIFNEDPVAASPVSAANMVFKWPPSGLRSEAKLFAGTKQRIRKWLWVYGTSMVQFFLERFDREAGGYNAPVYRKELRANSDFRRFDDTLRMILDCPLETAAAIESFFDDLHDQGKIAFGVHRSEHALMTCLVFSLVKGEHVHFVDGSDGGFTAAALQLKAQLRALAERRMDG